MSKMIAGILALLLLLLFAGIIISTFTMILHGGMSVGTMVKARFTNPALKALLVFYPFLMWLLVYALSEGLRVPNWFSVVFYYANLLLTIIAIETTFILRKEDLIYRTAFLLHLLNGSFITLLLLVYHFRID